MNLLHYAYENYNLNRVHINLRADYLFVTMIPAYRSLGLRASVLHLESQLLNCSILLYLVKINLLACDASAGPRLFWIFSVLIWP